MVISNSRDRTNEFQTAVKTFAEKRNDLHRSTQVLVHRHTSAMEQRSIFMQKAKRIGEDLSQTFAKLERLTWLARQSSLFNDKFIEIQDFILAIKEDISSLNQQITELQQDLSKTTDGKSRDSQRHSNSVLFVLQNKVATMSNDFKHILQAQIKNLAEQKSRRDNFSKNTTAASLSIDRSSILFRDDNTAGNSKDTIIDMNSERTFHSSMNRQLQVFDQSEDYYASRSEAIRMVEQAIAELGHIFNQLATVLQEQGESIKRIDDNVNTTIIHIEDAHKELLEHHGAIRSNRWLIIKVFGVLIIFFFIFIVFLV